MREYQRIRAALIRGVDKAVVDYEANCGNISQGVGPFAVDEGLVPVTEPVTLVRLFNTNTSKIIEAEVLTKSAMAGTARRIMDGFVYVPSRLFV